MERSVSVARSTSEGRADGGDGGRGETSSSRSTGPARPVVFQGTQRFRAGTGGSGRGTNRHGADGDDVLLRVPVGTQLFSEDGELIADLAGARSRVVAARGGSGGRGNKKFATPTRRAPRFAEVGMPARSSSSTCGSS